MIPRKVALRGTFNLRAINYFVADYVLLLSKYELSQPLVNEHEIFSWDQVLSPSFVKLLHGRTFHPKHEIISCENVVTLRRDIKSSTLSRTALLCPRAVPEAAHNVCRSERVTGLVCVAGQEAGNRR